LASTGISTYEEVEKAGYTTVSGPVFCLTIRLIYKANQVHSYN